jgi:hypothetical protein
MQAVSITRGRCPDLSSPSQEALDDPNPTELTNFCRCFFDFVLQHACHLLIYGSFYGRRDMLVSFL